MEKKKWLRIFFYVVCIGLWKVQLFLEVSYLEKWIVFDQEEMILEIKNIRV